uniref:Shugoshin C-terminal domain-containing protein n=1 Tax=Chrysolophus pictus TaxID=9089 RepID=A0A8C3LXB2_CHRPC
MASRKASEASFGLSDVRERMREKKNGVLRTARLNASLASKIKTKIINNSSIIKVSLKHNNKALALALNAEKANAQRLAKEKVILQMELEQCHFQNAFLRNKLCFLNNILKELENLVESVKMARLSEYHTSHLSLSNGQKNSMTEDSWADDISDGHLLSAAAMPLRVPISKPTDLRQQSGSSTAVQKSSLDLQRCAPDKPLETLSVVSDDALPPQLAGKPQSPQKENGKNQSERMEAKEAFLDSRLFRESLCTTQENLNNLSALAWESCPLPYEDEMVKHFYDRLSQGHVTQRRKRSTWFATSTQSSSVDTIPHVSSARATWCGIVKDSSSFSESNTQPQLKSPSSLASPTEASGRFPVKEAFCDQLQAEETGCSVEVVDSSSSEVMEFVPVKIKSKVNCKTDGKKAAKKTSAGRKKTNMIKTSAKNGPDIPEENTRNAKKLILSEVAAWPSGSEASDMEQKACVGALELKNGVSGAVQSLHSPNNVRIRRTYMVNPPQLNSLGSGDLAQAKKDGIVEIQSMESSLLKIPVHTVSSHEVPSDDCSLQNLFLLRDGTSSTCALWEDSSSVTTKSIRQKTNRKTRVISQVNDSEENLLSSMEKIPEAKAEEQCKSSQIRRRKTVTKSSCSGQKNEGNFGPFVGIQGIAQDGTRDSLDKCRKRTYFVCPLDLTGNLGCVQTDFEKDEMVQSRCMPGSKASKIPRVQRKEAAQNNKKQTGDPLEKEQTKVVNTGSLEKESNCKPKSRRKRKTSTPPKTSSVDKQSDGASVLHESSTVLVSEQTVLTEKYSCPTNLLSELGASQEEQIADISLTNKLMDLSQSLESSSVICSTDLPVSCGLTDLPVSKNSETKGNGTPEKSLCLESSLLFKEGRAEEASGERSKVVSSFKHCSQSSPPQEPEIRPLQDLTNARTPSLVPSVEEVPERASRRRPDPACYREPSLKCKLRRGDPFTNREFLHSPVYKTKKKRRPKTKELTKNIKEEQLPQVPVPTQAS